MSNALFQKVLKLVPLSATGPEVYAITMINVISDYYNDLQKTLNYLNSLKLRIFDG